jgi:molybdopterin converting factor subunit 1
MEITIRYFAAAREAAGVESETLELPDGADVAAAREQAAGRHPALAPLLPRCAVALNRSYATPQTTLRDGDELALLPPVGGG